MIYLDNAATTRIRSEVIAEMMPYLEQYYGNASASYSIARKSHIALDRARESIRSSIGAKFGNEIYFTSCGSEADNWALKGIAEKYRGIKNHIITSSYEHHAILECCKYLEGSGFEVTYINPDENGIVSPEKIENAVRDDTFLISVMYVNNETGSVNNIKEITEIAHRHNIVMHTDAVQAAGHLKIDVEELGVDMLSLSAHKFHGPKGIGCLYIKNGLKLENLIHGGSQERGKRAGTENVASIAGMAKALKLSVDAADQNYEYVSGLKKHFIERVLKEVPEAHINGNSDSTVPYIVNISFPGNRADAVVMKMDMKNIACSGGSACTAGSIGDSHVLVGMGLDSKLIGSAVRFSFSIFNTMEEIDQAVDALAEIVNK